ncbi:hypothetical protein JOC77_000200 [Peribacillus deserti]|uniref:PepSY domain-containing protein n=1 Tax=Peribacillus deserti TaxID=673318 RepID=A0ABS2QCA3_9BACI|nr:hypothetical protein [Peribacillus deserti]MBM7690797.1 hypothetical protein [Peribacillus deserti]
MEEQQIFDTSKQVAIKFMKDEFGVDFEVKDVGFSPMGAVNVEGYDQADKKNEIQVRINQDDNYDVTGVDSVKDLPKPKTINEVKNEK